MAEDRDFTLEELRLLKLAITLATDAVEGRPNHRELEQQLDEMYRKLRSLGA